VRAAAKRRWGEPWRTSKSQRERALDEARCIANWIGSRPAWPRSTDAHRFASCRVIDLGGAEVVSLPTELFSLRDDSDVCGRCVWCESILGVMFLGSGWNGER
jgi:hypothetical protein